MSRQPRVTPCTAEDALAVATFLLYHWTQCDDQSVDPYDALASTRLPLLRLWPRTARLALVQFNKRLPFDLRPLEGISPTRSAYTVAHFASAAIARWRLAKSEQDLALAQTRLDWLCENQVARGWAYPFDVQTKTFYYRRTTPNAICTAFALRALCNGVKQSHLTSQTRWLEAIHRGAFFALQELKTDDARRCYFRYLPGRGQLIHNANLLIAQAVAEAGALTGETTLVNVALECARTSLEAIDDGGGIVYGEGPKLGWIDGHHTGFVTEAVAELASLAEAAGHLHEAEELSEAAHRLGHFYRQHLFDPCGRPRSSPAKTYPIDVLAGAQGVQTFAILSPEHIPFAQVIAGYMVSNLRSTTGTFLYQKGRLHTKKVPYARWSDAPMCLALITLAERLEALHDDPIQRRSH